MPFKLKYSHGVYAHLLELGQPWHQMQEKSLKFTGAQDRWECIQSQNQIVLPWNIASPCYLPSYFKKVIF